MIAVQLDDIFLFFLAVFYTSFVLHSLLPVGFHPKDAFVYIYGWVTCGVSYFSMNTGYVSTLLCMIPRKTFWSSEAYHYIDRFGVHLCHGL